MPNSILSLSGQGACTCWTDSNQHSYEFLVVLLIGLGKIFSFILLICSLMRCSRGSLEVQASVGLQTGSCTQRARQDWWKRKTSPDWQVEGLINKGTSYARLVLGDCKMSRSLHPLTRILKVSIEAFTGFSHIFSPDGFNNTLLPQDYILDTGFHCGNGEQKAHSKEWERVRSLWLLWSSSSVNLQSHPLNQL